MPTWPLPCVRAPYIKLEIEIRRGPPIYCLPKESSNTKVNLFILLPIGRHYWMFPSWWSSKPKLDPTQLICTIKKLLKLKMNSAAFPLLYCNRNQVRKSTNYCSQAPIDLIFLGIQSNPCYYILDNNQFWSPICGMELASWLAQE